MRIDFYLNRGVPPWFDPAASATRRAQEIGDILMHAFDTPTGIPHGTINLKSLRSYNPSWSGGASGQWHIHPKHYEITRPARHHQLQKPVVLQSLRVGRRPWCVARIGMTPFLSRSDFGLLPENL